MISFYPTFAPRRSSIQEEKIVHFCASLFLPLKREMLSFLKGNYIPYNSSVPSQAYQSIIAIY